MPFIRRSSPPAERLEAFHHFEGRVAPQTSFWVLLAGASGFWMTWRADLWDRFAALQFCWMHAMVALRLFFAVMRFIIEPPVLHRRMANSSKPAAYLQRMERLHQIGRASCRDSVWSGRVALGGRSILNKKHRCTDPMYIHIRTKHTHK